MAQIDIGKVAFAGFHVIGRKPMALVGWTLFLFVVGVLPAVALMGPVMGSFANMVSLAESAATPDPRDMMRAMSGLYSVIPVLMLTGLLVRIMLTGAIFRAILEPSASGWAYLRLGMAEIMMALVVVVLAIIVFAAIGAVALLIFAACAALWQASHAAAIGTGVLLGVVSWLVLIWVLLRLSLAAPMSFAEKNFRLFESWRVTKGNSLRLLLTALIQAVILGAFQLVIRAVVTIIALPVLHLDERVDGLSEESLAAFFHQPMQTWMPQVLPWVIGIGLIISLLTVVFVTVATAPWAEAYRQLRKTPDALV